MYTGRDEKKPNITLCLLISASILFTSLSGSNAQAHSIEYHMRPLDAATVEQVVQSLQAMIGEIQRQGVQDSLRLPTDEMAATTLLWSIQQAMIEIDESGTLDNPRLKRALLSAGYADSPYVVEEWQADAEQVLETYEVVRRGLDRAEIQARYARFHKELPQLEEEEAVRMESALIRDQQLLRTTAADLELIRQFSPQLDALAAQLGMPVN